MVLFRHLKQNLMDGQVYPKPQTLDLAKTARMQTAATPPQSASSTPLGALLEMGPLLGLCMAYRLERFPVYLDPKSI